jgi:hypothetical protein
MLFVSTPLDCFLINPVYKQLSVSCVSGLFQATSAQSKLSGIHEITGLKESASVITFSL